MCLLVLVNHPIDTWATLIENEDLLDVFVLVVLRVDPPVVHDDTDPAEVEASEELRGPLDFGVARVFRVIGHLQRVVEPKVEVSLVARGSVLEDDLFGPICNQKT